MADLALLQDDVLDQVLDQRLREKVDGILGEVLYDGEQLRERTLRMADRYREAYVTNVWLNNGWENTEDALRYQPGAERNQHRMQYGDLVQAIDASAKDLLEAATAEDDDDDGGLADAMHPKDAPLLLPKVIINIVREAAEPILVGVTLFREIRFTGAGETITFPATGAFNASDLAPGQEYPEKQLEFSGQVFAKIGKSGVKIRITEEVLRYSMFDVMSLHFQAAGRAMARHKETKIWNLINSEGVVSFDNGGGTSIHGRSSGRDISGLLNNTYTVNDLFVQFADLLNAGFVPNVLCMNPMGWLIFARDPVMRNLAFEAGNGGGLWQRPQGQPGLAPAFQIAGANLLASAGKTAQVQAPLMANATLMTPPPGFFPVPFRVVVSPFVAYDPTARTTTIIMADVNGLGILITDEELVTEAWDDPNRDITAVKFRERYALAIDNEGEAVSQAKGVSLCQGFDFEQKIRWQAGTGALPTGVVTGVPCPTP